MWFQLENWLFLRTVWLLHHLSNRVAKWGERLDKKQNALLRDEAYRKE